jgi:hypothetical protein
VVVFKRTSQGKGYVLGSKEKMISSLKMKTLMLKTNSRGFVKFPPPRRVTNQMTILFGKNTAQRIRQVSSSPSSSSYQTRNQFKSKFSFSYRRSFVTTTTTAAEETATKPPVNGSTVNKLSSYVPSSQKMLLYSVGIATTYLGISYLPQLKTTREGIIVAWNWKDLTPDELTDIAEAYVWQFWIAIAGLLAGSSATGAAVNKAITKPGGSLFVPLKIPLLVLGGVLGAKLTTSTAKSAAEFIIFTGRLAEFTLDGLMVDFFNKPRHELRWVQKGIEVNKTTGGVKKEAVPYETKSDNVLRDLALVQGDINDPKACGPYRHKLLLARELGRLREQERILKQSSQDSQAIAKRLKQIEDEKARLKKMCKQLYGFKISRLFEEIQVEAALKLEDLRAEQVDKAMQRAPLSELYALDREKAKLKAQAKLALGVRLSIYTKPSRKWKDVLRDVQASSAVT